MYGYGSRKIESEGIAGRLFARALALGSDQEQGPALLLCVENGHVPVKLRDEVYHRLRTTIDIKPERFVLANSHTHAGPDISGYDSLPPEHQPHIAQYMTLLTDRLERVAREALAARMPARLAWAQGKVGFAANRRVLQDGKWKGFGAVPDAPADHSLPVLRVTDASGKLLAVVINYACHCTTLRGNFKQIHGDWAGSAQRFLEAEHPGAKALICIGCGADADPCPHGTAELCDQHGRALADEVNRLLAGPMTPIQPRLITRRIVLQMPYRTPPDPAELEKRAKRSWNLEDLLKRLRAGESFPPLQYPITTWTFGSQLAMVFLTGEVVVDYSLRLKRELDGSRLWITAYAHDVPCYVVSQRILQEGGYEERNSISSRISFGQPQTVQPPIEDRICKAVHGLLPKQFAMPR